MRVAQKQSSSAPQIAKALTEMYAAAPPSDVTACLCVHMMYLIIHYIVLYLSYSTVIQHYLVWTVVGVSALVPDRFGWGMRLCCSAPRLLLSDRPLSHSFVITFLCHYLQLRTLGVLFSLCPLLLVIELLILPSPCKGALCASQSPPFYHSTFTFPPAESPDNIISLISTGAGIFVDNGAPAGVLSDNSIVRGGTINFQCRSGSLDTGVGQLVDLDGNTFNIGQNNGVFSVASLGNPVQPGSIRIRTVTSLTAAVQGVYSCRIPDETGNDVDVNIGVYQNGFNSESVHLPVMLYSIGSMY